LFSIRAVSSCRGFGRQLLAVAQVGLDGGMTYAEELSGGALAGFAGPSWRATFVRTVALGRQGAYHKLVM
jgi:hypothetical protein